MKIIFTKPVIISENYSNNTTCNNNGISRKRSLVEQKNSSDLVKHNQETRIDTLIQNEVGTFDYSLEKVLASNKVRSTRVEGKQKKFKKQENIYNSKWALSGEYILE
ncbi:14100_t:CDS:1, partial [Dentiscutata erythropus]